MPANQDLPLVENEFGNYSVIDRILSGRGNSLYLAYDGTRDCSVFLSVADTAVAGDPVRAERLKRSLHVVAKLRHTNIAPIYHVGSTLTGRPLVAIEYSHGALLSRKLETWTKDGTRLPVADALNLVRQLANGLDHASRANIVHHDLTPENILVDDNHAPILFNLGLPDLISGWGRPYASPEQLRGERPTVLSNIYSVGVILYEILAGSPPELQASQWDIFNLDENEQTSLVPLESARPGLSPATYRLVRDCLWPEPWNRFQTYAELIIAVDRAKAAELAPVQTVPATQGGYRWLQVAAPVTALAILIIALLLTRGAAGDTQTLSSSEPLKAVVVPVTAAVEPTPNEIAKMPAIRLLTPAAGASFQPADPVSFSWTWSYQLEPEWRFAVYLQSEDSRILVASTDKLSEGGHYLVQKSAEADVATGTYFWQVVVEETATGMGLHKSDTALLSFENLLAETVVPSSTEPTTTPAAVVQTATPVCRSTPPLDWSRHTIMLGDTLARLSLRFSVDISEIQRVNCLPSSRLTAGQTLWLPRPGEATAPVAASPTTAPPTNTLPPPPPSNTDTPPPPTGTPAPPPPPPPTSTPIPPLPTNTPMPPPPTNTPLPPPTLTPIGPPPTEPPPTLTPASELHQ